MLFNKGYTHTIFFLFLCFCAYSQVSNSDTEKIPFYDLEFEKRANNGPDTLFMLLYNFDVNDSKKKLTYDCLPNYNIEILNVSVVTYDGPSNKYYLTRKSDNKTEDYTRSIFFIFTSSPKIQKLIDDNLFKLSLERYQSRNGVVTYKITKIDNQDVFCWKLSQAIKFFESNKELFKEEEKPTEKVEEKNKFSINLSTAALLSGKIKSSAGPYSNQLGINQQPMRFAIDFQYWMNNFRLGLGYAYSSFQFNNNLADSSYSTTWNSNYLGASNELNVYYKNIQEKINFQNNNLYLLAGYSIPFSNNKLRVDIDASFQYSLPFVVNSKLANGEFTYRAQVNGIEDEMMNIPELGLVENDLSSRGRESNFKMHGIGFNVGSNIVYSYKNFDIKFGLGYNYNSYTNEKYNENSRMTELVGDYKSSLLSSKTISAQFFMLQLALGYTIK